MAIQQLPGKFRASGLLTAVLALLAARPSSQPPTQAQIARRFLAEVLRAEYPAAYRRLAPEVQARLLPTAFVSAAQPLRQLGEQHGQAIELYKLGTRLSARGGHGQWFYSFSFARDSLHKPPPVLLEVTFRDTTARQVLGFRVRAHP